MRAYQANPGDSFTFGGNSFVADEAGAIVVDDTVPHDELISHGFTLAAERAASDETPSGEPVAKRRGRKPAQE